MNDAQHDAAPAGSSPDAQQLHVDATISTLTGESLHTVAVALAQFYGERRRQASSAIRQALDVMDMTPDQAPAEHHDRNKCRVQDAMASFQDARTREFYHAAVAAGHVCYGVHYGEAPA